MVRANNRRGSFLSLLELVIVLAIVLFLAHRGILSYFKPAMDQPTREAAKEAGINTENYRSLITSTGEKVSDIMDKRFSDVNAALGDASR